MASSDDHSTAEAAPSFARIVIQTPISVIVPTYKEVENIPHLIERVRRLREAEAIEIELLFMDDMSRDGSVETVASSGQPWVRIIERKGERGLSPAVIDGFRAARHPVLVCMDCDLSHPPEKIPQMILALASGVPATPTSLVEDGPELLCQEILAVIKSECFLNEEERKN